MTWPGYDLTQLQVVQVSSWFNSDFDFYELTRNPLLDPHDFFQPPQSDISTPPPPFQLIYIPIWAWFITSRHNYYGYLKYVTFMNFRELEKISSSVTTSAGGIQLGNSSVITLDPALDKTPLHSQLTQSYKWSNKVHTCVFLKIQHMPHIVGIVW